MTRMDAFTKGAALALLLSVLAPAAWGQQPRFRLHVVGLAVEPGTEDQLRAIAAAAGGQYIGAGQTVNLSTALGQALGAPAAPQAPASASSSEVELNDSLGRATPISDTASVAGTINPVRDRDWYRFTVGRQGSFQIRITNSPPEVDVAFRLVSPDAVDLTGWRSARAAGGDNDAVLPLPEAGTYYLELADGGDDASSVNPYTLRLAFLPP